MICTETNPKKDRLWGNHLSKENKSGTNIIFLFMIGVEMEESSKEATVKGY